MGVTTPDISHYITPPRAGWIHAKARLLITPVHANHPPATDAIAFTLGDAKLTPESAGRDIYLLMDGQGSQTMSIDPQGNPVFTKLVPTPEPTTGALGLLALAALASRRRKDN